MVRVSSPPTVTEEDEFYTTVSQYLRMKAIIADMTKEANKLRDSLSEQVETRGEADDSGSYWLPLESEIEGVASLKRERRVSHSLDDEVAERILKERGLYDRCYDTVPVLNQDEVMTCLVEELLTQEEVEEMFPAKVTWAFVPKKA